MFFIVLLKISGDCGLGELGIPGAVIILNLSAQNVHCGTWLTAMYLHASYKIWQVCFYITAKNHLSLADWGQVELKSAFLTKMP